ncbi:hypothetical protein [Kineococcus sp. SYSU DK001]|uniref:hypothetical protein n=1 Tax=Kineococcus sp. SYSU DK001 TaxID=3383122 RepID=UPI003D7F107A
MPGTRRALFTLPLAAACLLTACSASSAGDEAEERKPPLATYFESFYGTEGSEAEQQAKYDEQNKRTEELVARCMSEQGFEYTPNTANSAVSFSSGEEWDPDSREWVSQYGYGMVKSPGSENAEEAPPEEYVDPNADLIASLSESEQVAYQEALSGPAPSEEDMAAMEDGSYEWDWTKNGCYGQAQHEVAGDDPTQSDEFKGLMEEINTFYEGQSSWPAVAEADAAWSSCMSEAGHGGFATQSDAQNSLNEKLNKVYESTGPEGEVDQAALDALGEEEVEVALADLDCREETDYRTKVTDAAFEQEQRFVDDHKTELDAMKAAAEQGN